MLFATLLSAVVILLLLYLGSRKPSNYPPGPKWWPVVGSLFEVARIRRETGYLFKTCSALYERYGPVAGLKIGRDLIVVLNDYKSMRAILLNEDCDGRPSGPIYRARTWGERKGLIVVDGQLWMEQRRFVLRHLREFGFGRTSMAAIIEDEAEHLVMHFKRLLRGERGGDGKRVVVASKENGSSDNNDRNNINNNANNMNNNNNDNNGDNDGQIYKLCSSDGSADRQQRATERSRLTAADMYVKVEQCVEPGRRGGLVVPMHDAFGVSVLNTLWRMMAGKRFNTDDTQLTYLQRILTKLLREIDMIGAPFSHFPFLRFVAPEMSGYASFLRTHRQLWKFLKDELNDHKTTLKPNAPRDLMDVYLTVLQSGDHGETFSESQLLAICVDLFMAGSETTSKALGFCFLYLVLFPRVQAKAQEEIDAVIGRSRLPSLADRPMMPYMQAIVLESLRMFMGRTLNVPHRAMRDTSIAGYTIPKDTMIIANFNRVLMDDSWGDPEVFRPERFIDENGAVAVPDKYLPFSIGRHRCMGESLAKSNIFLITAALLQTFAFSTVPGEAKPSMHDFVDGVTAGPKPYRVLISLRT